jgi:hypothetical protein
VWEVGVHVVPILIAVVVATVKIVDVLRKEIRAEIGPLMSRIDDVENRFVAAVRDIWDHSSSQDVKIEAVMRGHYELKGSHDAIVKMGGHGERRINPRPGCTTKE